MTNHDYRADERAALHEYADATALAVQAEEDAARDGLVFRWQSYAMIAALAYREQAHRAQLAANTARHHWEHAG